MGPRRRAAGPYAGPSCSCRFCCRQTEGSSWRHRKAVLRPDRGQVVVLNSGLREGGHTVHDGAGGPQDLKHHRAAAASPSRIPQQQTGLLPQFLCGDAVADLIGRRGRGTDTLPRRGRDAPPSAPPRWRCSRPPPPGHGSGRGRKGPRHGGQIQPPTAARTHRVGGVGAMQGQRPVDDLFFLFKGRIRQPAAPTGDACAGAPAPARRQRRPAPPAPCRSPTPEGPAAGSWRVLWQCCR